MSKIFLSLLFETGSLYIALAVQDGLKLADIHLLLPEIKHVCHYTLLKGFLKYSTQ